MESSAELRVNLSALVVHCLGCPALVINLLRFFVQNLKSVIVSQGQPNRCQTKSQYWFTVCDGRLKYNYTKLNDDDCSVLTSKVTNRMRKKWK